MTDFGEIIDRAFQESIDLKREFLEKSRDRIISCTELMLTSLKGGGKILLAGNGGSAAEAQHFASELVGRLWKMNRPAIPAIALTTDTSILTSVSNDFGFDECFARQVEAHGAEGDILIGITTSGNSENIIRAMRKASGSGIRTIGVLGADGGAMVELVDDYVLVQSDSTPRVQECHHLLTHIFTSIIEDALYGSGS